MSFRAFVSVDVGAHPRLVDLHEELAAIDAALKPVDPQQYHLTLKFLGDVDAGQVDEVLESMRLASKGVEPFTCRLQGVGAFPDEDFIKVVWAGLEEADPLVQIADRLASDLDHIQKEDHGFSPHLTLARMKGGQGKAEVQAFLDDHRDDDLGELAVRDIRLKRSDLQPEGPVYTTVEQVPLG